MRGRLNYKSLTWSLTSSSFFQRILWANLSIADNSPISNVAKSSLTCLITASFTAFILISPFGLKVNSMFQ